MSTARRGFPAAGSSIYVWQRDEPVGVDAAGVALVVFLIVILGLWACVLLSLIDILPGVPAVNQLK